MTHSCGQPRSRWQETAANSPDLSRHRRLSEREAADRLGVSPRTLQDWRRRSCGPVYLKMGRRVAYHPNDLDAFEAACRVQPKLKEGA